jgi:hypothetical protein
VALQPKYREAMAYLALLHRQKAIAFFAEPDKWQATIDAAEKWSRAAAQVARGEPASSARGVPSREGLGTLPGFPSRSPGGAAATTPAGASAANKRREEPAPR